MASFNRDCQGARTSAFPDGRGLTLWQGDTRGNEVTDILRQRWLLFVVVLLCSANRAWADPPVASYIFPAGGQRGKAVDFHVGGLFLHKSCPFEMLGPGVEASKQLQRTKTLWFEGPVLQLPDSQQTEDYPKDLAGRVQIAGDAPLGVRYWRLWNSQGATPAMKFMVGDLPEIVEHEIDGDPVPVEVKLPVTINGRIFPREDVDIWTFQARKGQTISCEVHAARLGSPLDSRLEVLDPQGHTLAENDDTFGADSFVRFTAPADGKYQIKIHDINFRGGQAYVYRLTLTADPYVDRVYPLGGQRGSKVAFELTGQGVPSDPVTITLPAEAPADFVHRLSAGTKQSNPFLIDLDDLPEHREVEPNDEPSQVQPVTVPAILNGRIGRPGDLDYWSFNAKKDEVYELDLRASRLGSPLTAILTLFDSAGKELARSEYGQTSQADPFLRFSVPADGTYQVRVEERFRARGGPAFAYRLRIAPPAAADFRLHFANDVVLVNRDAAGGGKTRGAPPERLKIVAERLGGFAEPITLAIDGLPPGVTVSPTVIAAKQPGVDLTFKTDSTAAIGASRLTIRGTAKVGDRTLTKTATLTPVRGLPELDSVLVALTLPTPFKIVGDYDMRWAPRGSVHHRHYRIERNGFDGPIEISLSDKQSRHLQGVTGPTITVPAGVSEFDYAVHLPPWMETGRTSRTCVMGTSVVKDADGREHVVSFCSIQQNEQVVVVIEPGRLGLESNRATLVAAPGKSVDVAVEVTRNKSLQGPAKLELISAAHMQGISAEPIMISADRNHATISIRFAADVRGPFNLPIVLRATVMDKGEPVVAETKVSILPER